MVDALNAEVSLGTIANVSEAIQWLGYTYLFGETDQRCLEHNGGADTDQFVCARNRSYMVSQTAYGARQYRY
jgi:hypothetical protein